MAKDLAIGRSAAPRRSQGPLRLLLCDSLPLGLGGGFRFDRKEEGLRRRLAPFLRSGAIELQVAPALDSARLGALLGEFRPDIFHLVCHGTGEALKLEDRHGQLVTLDAAELVTIYRECGSCRPRLTILEACRSLKIAEALSKASDGDASGDQVAVGRPLAPWVIGNRDFVDPAIGTIFFPAFEQALAAGATIEGAFAEARRDLELLVPTVPSPPVLCSHASVARDERLVDAKLWIAHGSLRNGGDDHVFRSAALGALDVPFHDRSARRNSDLGVIEGARSQDVARPAIAMINDVWIARSSPVLHLRGAAGIGKSVVVRRWLDRLAVDRWPGASRVFAWSFDPSASGAGVGDVHRFLDHALDFFGDRDRDRDRSPDDRVREAWVRGLRLGRMLRREPCLLVLDAAPTLPQGTDAGEACSPEAILHPGLAGLLRELAGATEGLCVLVTRDDCPWLEVGVDAQGPRAQRLELGALTPAASAELLWNSGLIDTPEKLARTAAAFGHHPLALVIAARSFRTGAGALSALPKPPKELPPIQRALDSLQGLRRHAVEALTLLALRGGSLRPEDLKALAEYKHSGPPHRAIRALVRHRGLAISPGGHLSMTLIHRAVGEAWLCLDREDLTTYAPLCRDDGAAKGEDSLVALLARARVVKMSLQTGNIADALSIYVDEIARYDHDAQQWSFIARKRGAIAEDLEILAHFVERDGRGHARWATLRRDVAVNLALPQAFRPRTFPSNANVSRMCCGYILHRIALALRHLGRAREAWEPMVAALKEYEGAPDVERAATCANDLAELEVWLGKLDAALQSARLAENYARESGDGTVRQLCLATLGHVLHMGGALIEAGSSFALAQQLTAKLSEADERFTSPVLCSRPGFQHWEILLDQIDSALLHREPADDRINQLVGYLQHSEAFHARGHVAGVSLALTCLARGRLAVICAIHRRPMPKLGSEAGDLREATGVALIELARAIATFREHQHAWMLPLALLERARLYREVLGDPRNASLDLDEVSALADGLGLPLMQIACAIEEAQLRHGTTAGQEAADRAQRLLIAHPCQRLALRLDIISSPP